MSIKAVIKTASCQIKGAACMKNVYFHISYSQDYELY